MSTPDPIQVLLGSLEPSEPLSSTITFLDWYRTRSAGPDLEVLALHPGTAAAAIRAVARTSVVYDPHGWSVSRMVQRAGLQKPAASLRAAELRRRLQIQGPVYVADVDAARLLHRLGPDAGPVVTHLHATGPGLGHLDEADRRILVERTDRWIAGSDDARTQAVEAGADPGVIVVLPDLLSLPGIGDLDADFLASVRRDLADRLQIPTDAPLAVGVGSVDWWQVPDAFLRVAWEVVRRDGGAGAQFLWVADGATDRMLWPLRHDIRHAGLESVVHIDTGDGRPWHQIAAADVLVSSRLGDHQPIGHREAALLDVPVVWFDDPGRPPLVDADQGQSVPHLDIAAMADAVVATFGRDAGRDRSHLPAGRPAPWLPIVGGSSILDLLTGTVPTGS
ncbi:MAG: hypothetical protein KDB04_09250 [Acidimicrobiales bacterium]|nr:hypothetical protein [Acidimicrobiales bacterium]HRW36490.1 hypothetical protein [Aquihabitans sp.]